MERKTALITGASRGIGAGIAKVLAQEGYDLILLCRRNERMLNDIAYSFNKHLDCEVLTHCGEICDENFVNEVRESAETFFGHIDVLVNNAGTWMGGLVQDTTVENFNRLISVNLTGTFLMCKTFVPMMLKQKSGSIINISSMWGISGAAMESAYSATKGGVNAFTKSLAKELAPSNITVNAIAPGVIDTDMNKVYTKEDLESLCDEIPMGRFGTPEDIGKTVLGVINSPYLTGQIITVDGGFL